MADHEDEDLQMAIRMSLQGSSTKRSKPIDKKEEEEEEEEEEERGGESPEARERRLQRELRAAAAERRIDATMSKAKPMVMMPEKEKGIDAKTGEDEKAPKKEKVVPRSPDLGQELHPAVVERLFSMLFGSDVSAGILTRWSNQGIRFSSDPDTSIGLVQHEGGPCGVLAAIQAFVLKYLIFLPKDCMGPQTSRQERLSINPTNVMGNFTPITEDMKGRALVHSMVDILFLCGKKERAAVATLNISTNHLEGRSESGQMDEAISRALEGLTIESASDLQKVLRVSIFSSRANTFNRLMMELPVFRSRMGAMLFLISALFSRGLDSIQDDRDDPSLPLVTAPFGHASQEIVNLLLCGQAAPNVFDGRMDLGGGMFLEGIPGSVEVGFLTLLESLNFCKVGQYLKCPKWPIWVVGSESHYTVLFALDTSVQDENELEQWESKIRRVFDAQDQSGGGGFISVDGFHKVLGEMGINLPSEKLNSLCSSGFIVWSEFSQVLLDLDKDLGGLKDSATSGKKQFDIYHFNGIAKSVSNGNQVSGGETPAQRPRLCKLCVVVPPSWSQEGYLSDITSNSDHDTKNRTDVKADQLPEPLQHAPLVDCIRTRWPRAVCRWDGDPPSIV